jgi:anaerobic dimethyl sulfoxide reductase subunit B (iron-sulfur subunit)
VVVDQSLCVPGCRACLYACPYDAPQFRSEDSRMEKCDFCLDRLEQGAEPLCVASCPLRALDAGPLEELRATYRADAEAPGFSDSCGTHPSILFRPRSGSET